MVRSRVRVMVRVEMNCSSIVRARVRVWGSRLWP